MMKIRRRERTLWIANAVLVIMLLSTICLILLRGLGPVDQNHSSEVGDIAVAYFNNEPILNGEWEQELKQKYGQEVLIHLLNRKAVFEEAEKLSIHISSEEVTTQVKKDMRGYDSEEAYYHEMETQLGLSPKDVESEMKYKLTLEQIAISGIDISEEQIDSYFEENKDQFEPRKQFQLSVIKVSSQGEAEDVLNQLEQGSDFTELASEYSTDESSRNKGGRIGAVESDDPFLPQEMLDAVDALQTNDIAGPFRWDEDYVVIQLTDIMEGEQEDTATIRKSIHKLLALNEAAPLTELEKILRDKYDVRIVATSGL